MTFCRFESCSTLSFHFLQYPVLDISSRSRLSSVCWSSYIKVTHLLSVGVRVQVQVCAGGVGGWLCVCVGVNVGVGVVVGVCGGVWVWGWG